MENSCFQKCLSSITDLCPTWAGRLCLSELSVNLWDLDSESVPSHRCLFMGRGQGVSSSWRQKWHWISTQGSVTLMGILFGKFRADCPDNTIAGSQSTLCVHFSKVWKTISWNMGGKCSLVTSMTVHREPGLLMRNTSYKGELVLLLRSTRNISYFPRPLWHLLTWFFKWYFRR